MREESLDQTANDIIQSFHLVLEFVSGQNPEGRILHSRKHTGKKSGWIPDERIKLAPQRHLYFSVPGPLAKWHGF